MQHEYVTVLCRGKFSQLADLITPGGTAVIRKLLSVAGGHRCAVDVFHV